jgi:predicted acylesterase/phospholipase RssA
MTGRLAGHVVGTLRYEVLENLTAIVLSGGGAKGSFEVGALLYLSHQRGGH